MARGAGKSGNKADNAGNVVDGDITADDGNGFRLGEPVTVDPAAALGSTDDAGSGGNSGGSGSGADLTPTGRQRRKYGKRTGSAAGSSSEETVRVDIVTQLLFSSHMMLAAITKTPEFGIETSEAEQIAKAYATLAEFYPSLKQSEKTIAWVNMFSALGMVYGTRAVAIFKRKKMEAETETLPGQYPHNVRSMTQ